MMFTFQTCSSPYTLSSICIIYVTGLIFLQFFGISLIPLILVLILFEIQIRSERLFVEAGKGDLTVMERAGPFAKEDGNGENCPKHDVDTLMEEACVRMNKFEIDSGDKEDMAWQGTTSEVVEGPTPEGLLYTLPYLGLKELLVLEGASKVLRDAVRGDVLLWQQLHVEDPLNKGITNDSLVKLSQRAQGRLQSLNLVKCVKISEEAIETVITSNPLLQKVPACFIMDHETSAWQGFAIGAQSSTN